MKMTRAERLAAGWKEYFAVRHINTGMWLVEYTNPVWVNKEDRSIWRTYENAVNSIRIVTGARIVTVWRRKRMWGSLLSFPFGRQVEVKGRVTVTKDGVAAWDPLTMWRDV